MDGRHFGSEELRRRPNAMHRKFRLGLTKSLVRSDGLDAEFEALRSGRKNPELFARLFGLVECFKLRGGSVELLQTPATGLSKVLKCLALSQGIPI